MGLSLFGKFPMCKSLWVMVETFSNGTCKSLGEISSVQVSLGRDEHSLMGLFRKHSLMGLKVSLVFVIEGTLFDRTFLNL